ncbi:cinnamoyl-CoA reductase 1-like [Salvia splendens]|uniref:cinnamoyl-CoA reductase 1-like n=1 Tax=Salvia splendens TaxID=180675 RepID=UPI001C27D5AA|nr:cinnamoyl-CoA reductase 1-like [Salvia splendens]
MAENGKKKSVCVTGAGGYVASWLIKLLLSNGYTVHGTVRNPGDEKNGHLLKLENAAEKLKLFKADLFDFDSILTAVKGCDGVFHVASPATTSGPNPEVDIVEPAVKGTLNVLKACSEAKAGRVVLVSSFVAVVINPSFPKDKVLDEACWSDKEFCRNTNNWYCFSKIAAEAEAWAYAETNGLDLVSICPGIILGPMLQHTPNASTFILLDLFKGGDDEAMENNLRVIVDVRDVAEAMKLVYERPNAQGRYICTSHMIKNEDLVQDLKEIYPHHNYPKSFKQGRGVPQVSSQKLQGLGWEYRTLRETLVDSIENCKQIGLL